MLAQQEKTQEQLLMMRIELDVKDKVRRGEARDWVEREGEGSVHTASVHGAGSGATLPSSLAQQSCLRWLCADAVLHGTSPVTSRSG